MNAHLALHFFAHLPSKSGGLFARLASIIEFGHLLCRALILQAKWLSIARLAQLVWRTLIF